MPGICGLITLYVGMVLSMPVLADAQGPRVAAYTLDVAFAPAAATMRGEAVVRFNPSDSVGDSVRCYLHGELSVDSVLVDGVPTVPSERPVFYDFDYSLIAREITIPVAGAMPQSLTIAYSGLFNRSQSRSPSDYMRIDEGGVFLRAYGYSLWFPVFLPARADDYDVDFDRVTVRLPRGFTGVFVGARTGARTVGDTVITEWTAPNTSLFAAQLTARPFQILRGGAFEILHLPDSASADAARSILAFAQLLCHRYAARYRAPDTAAVHYVVQMPPYGDIASGGVTGLMESTWRVFSEDENAQRALAHELVHSYVRLDVPRDDSLYCLAVEGFPSYFHLPCVAEQRGAEFYNRFVGWMEKLYLDRRATGKDRRGRPVPPEKPLLTLTADDLPAYKDGFVLGDRALLFLNFLRARMGRRFDDFTADLFCAGVTSIGQFRAMIEKHLPGSAADVRIWLETTEYPERLRFDHYRMVEP
ncbi:MAG TPA: hypothetical protein VNN55_07485 [bacterium]|nr:hypothetical protein [bacterium]